MWLAVVAALCVALLPTHAQATPPEVERSLADARLVGEAPYQMLGLQLFHAALWSDASGFSWGRPFALTLTYRRSFSARALANRSVSEMSRRNVILDPAALRTRLQDCFADVSPGDRITGVSTSANTAVFYFNGRRRCVIEQRGFSRAFFGIWLEASGSDRPFRERLLGAG